MRTLTLATWMLVLPLMVQFSNVTSAQPATGPCYVSGSRDYVLIHRGNKRADGLFHPLVNRDGQTFPRLPHYYMDPGEFVFICSQHGMDIAFESPDGYAGSHEGLTIDAFKNRWGIVVSSTQSVPAAIAARVKLEEEDRKWAERARQQARAEAERRAQVAAAETKKQEARNAIIMQLGASLIIAFLIMKIFNKVREKTRQETQRKENERLQREGEENARKQTIEYSKSRLAQLVKSSQEVAASMPTLVSEAQKHLDMAEYEFSEGVFARFWDEIENAANKLAEYTKNLEWINQLANQYQSEASSLLPVKSPPFTLDSSKLQDARPTAQRLSKIVREAQKDFHFSTIYEQRKTNRLLHEGFRSLGDAIYFLGDRISSSLNDLSDRLDISFNDLINAQHQHNEDMNRHFDDLKDIASQEANARRKFEKESVSTQKEQTDILDNIQRGRKPFL